MIEQKIISERITILRTEKELSQLDLAKILSEMTGKDTKVLLKCINRWETGEGEPSIEMFQNLAIVLSVQKEYLMGLIDAR